MLARQTVLVSVVLEGGDGCGAQGQSTAIGDAEGDPWIASRVTDISREGCGLISSLLLIPGMSVRVMFPGFEERLARVVWTKGQVAGCAFATALPAAILDYILRMSDPAARG